MKSLRKMNEVEFLDHLRTKTRIFLIALERGDTKFKLEKVLPRLIRRAELSAQKLHFPESRARSAVLRGMREARPKSVSN